MERGKIRNPAIASQLRDYSGLQFCRGITPTDIDGFVEFDDKVFFFIELKQQNATLPKGQKLALERLVDAIAPPREAILLIARHTTEQGQQIQADESLVSTYRYKRQWRKPQRETTVREAITKFIQLVTKCTN